MGRKAYFAARAFATIRSGRSRNRARAGSSQMAPTMFQRNMKNSRNPMSAWNLIGEKIQVTTPMPRVTPVNTTALPVDLRVSK